MLNINGLPWRVLIVSPNHPMLERPNGSFAIGVCDLDDLTICISEDLDPVMRCKVVRHELTHAVLYSFGERLPVAKEEMVADLVATYGREIVYLSEMINRELTEM